MVQKSSSPQFGLVRMKGSAATKGNMVGGKNRKPTTYPDRPRWTPPQAGQTTPPEDGLPLLPAAVPIIAGSPVLPAAPPVLPGPLAAGLTLPPFAYVRRTTRISCARSAAASRGSCLPPQFCPALRSLPAHYFLEERRIHFHQVAAVREAAFFYVRDVFLERHHALLL